VTAPGQGALLINGLNICTEVLCPIGKQVNAFFAFDRNDDRQTDLSQPDPVLSQLPFIQGADVYIPASSPPDATVSFQLISRGAEEFGRSTSRTGRRPSQATGSSFSGMTSTV